MRAELVIVQQRVGEEVEAVETTTTIMSAKRLYVGVRCSTADNPLLSDILDDLLKFLDGAGLIDTYVEHFVAVRAHRH